MATDLKKINKKSRIDLSGIRDQRGDKTHFIYELVQNADDSKSKRLELQLCEKELLVWNDGCKFNEDDVLRISSIGFSDKDLTQIGNFGTGFKTVYNYTNRPEVYSGDERFCLPDPTSTSKTLEDFASFSLVEGIDKVPLKIAELVEEGKTVFRLPFKEDLRQEDLTHLKVQLRGLLRKRPLLFLPHLEMIQWHDIRNGETGTYCRCPHGKIQSADQIELKSSINDEYQESERFLIFSKKSQPHQDVIDELLQIESDAKRRKRIQETAEAHPTVEVAFKLQDDKIIAMVNCVLFAYLPTEKETHLRFFIQARYQTTPARNDIEKTEQNPWNRWLVEETAKLLPEVLEELKEAGLLEPTFFNILPLKSDVENEFKPIAGALQKAMRERAFVPTEKKKNFAKAVSVFYPNTNSLRKLVKTSGMYPDSSLLHPDIRKGTKESGRCFEIMQESGVKEIDASDLLCWLETQSYAWFKNRTNEWLRSLYIYFNRKWSESEWDQIKELPLIRLENGQQVSANGGLAFFPPDTDEEREEIAPFLKELPILTSGLLEGDNSDEIKAFLKKLGVRALNPEEIINESICPKYHQSEKPSVAQNRLHVRYLFKVWDKISDTEIKKKISETPILRAYKGFQQENSDFVLPCNVYLSQTYTGNTDLENYFSAYNGEIWFVTHAYLENDSNKKGWIKFLKAIGAMDTPRTVEMDISANKDECQKRRIAYEKSTRPFVNGAFQSRQGNNFYDGHIKDKCLVGLSEVLQKINNNKDGKLLEALWYLLIKAIKPISADKPKWKKESQRDNFFHGSHQWFYSGKAPPRTFDAHFFDQLKKTTWLLDEQGNLRLPSECFAPTTENRNLLGDSVAYLHPDFDISQDNEPAQWLAEKLGVNLNASVDRVMNYLQNLSLSGSTANVEDIVSLYCFLQKEWKEQEEQGTYLQEEFKAKSLILTVDPEPCWWKTNEVFWEDESPVFGDRRGYLNKNYTDYERTLKPFFVALGITERASPLDYIRVIQEVTSEKQADNPEVRKRVKTLYHSLWHSLQKGGKPLEDEKWQEKWEETRDGKCWLGMQGSAWGFFYSDELVWNDHKYLADIFEGGVPFWGFNDDLHELINVLSIEGCSQAEIVAKPSGFQEKDHDWSEKVRNLHSFVHAFLKSPGLGNKKDAEAAKVITQLSVCRVEELEVTYKLKGVPRVDHKPPPSFLDENVQEAKLWLTLAVEKNEYAELISDALQEHFNVKDLGRFAEDLLTKDRDKVLSRWERKGLQTDLCMLPQEMVPDNEQLPELIDEKLPQETSSEHDVPEMIEPKVETPVPHEVPQTNSRDENSENDETETPTYPQSTNWTSQSGGHRRNTSNRGSGRGGRGGFGGGGEGEKHQYLKDYLVDNPSLFGEKLKLVNKEYRFKSGDKSDILLEDSSGKPVTVEVKPPISSGSDQEAWQAVKYKHLAAVEYGLQCNQVRSILVAPEIPDDVKEKCKKLGIEPIEVSLPNNTRNLKS